MKRLKRWWLRFYYGPACYDCGTPVWLNPPSDHETWLGHRWRRWPGQW